MPIEARPLALSAVVFANRFPGRRMILTVGPSAVVAELATTPVQTAQGLMGRTSLRDGEGMLFVMRSSDRHGFWMKNTTIPLSIAFVDDDGAIQEIRDLQPLSEESVVPASPARIMLEVPQGWFDRRGVAPGAKISLSR